MKYVSWMKMSTGVEAMKTPLSPPMTKIITKASAFSIGVVKRIDPPHRVPSQLNVLMADGTAITIVDIMKAFPKTGFIPLMNMWCPHTTQLRKPMEIMDMAIARYPKIGLREKGERTSEVTPIAGRTRT